MNLNLKNIIKESKNNASGITLIALVVTIVVLLILAGVSLNLVLGSNGIISKAKDAKNKTEQDKINTETALNNLFDEMVAAEGSSGSGSGAGETTYRWKKMSFTVSYVKEGETEATPWETEQVNFREMTSGIAFYNEPNYLCGSFTGGKGYSRYASDSEEVNVLILNECPYYACSSYLFAYVPGSFNTDDGARLADCYKVPLNTTVKVSQGTHEYGEVTSTKADAYPDNGFKDGYYYVKQ